MGQNLLKLVAVTLGLLEAGNRDWNYITVGPERYDIKT